VALLALPAAGAHAKAGDVDVTFGRGGEATVGIGGNAHLSSLALQPDGHILVGGWPTRPSGPPEAGRLVRLTPDGVLDSGFGQDGHVTSPTLIADVAVAPDGGIFVGGALASAPFDSVAVNRYAPDGELDRSFGDQGTAQLPWGTWSRPALAVAGDGSVVAAGGSVGADGLLRFAVARLRPDGRADPSFGEDGVVFAAGPSAGGSAATAVALQPDGRIVAGGLFSYEDAPAWTMSGVASPDFGLMRFNQDGSRDDTFGNGGVLRVRFGESTSQLNALAIATDGRIVAGGEADRLGGPGPDMPSGRTFAAARLLPDGQLDPSYGDGGKARLTVDGFVTGNAMALQPDGKVVMGGGYIFGRPLGDIPGSGKGLALGRLDAAGLPDATFGNGSVVRTIAAPGVQEFRGLVLQDDGKTVAGGESEQCGATVFTLLRYHGDATGPGAPVGAPPHVGTCTVPPVEFGGSVIPLPVTCPLVAEVCEGSAGISLPQAKRSVARPAAKRRGRFRVRGGRTGKARVKLARSVRRRLVRRRRIRAVATFTVRGGNGSRRVIRRRVTLRVAGRRGRGSR
jgi:uncharacterized delta-60 repeat protein